MNNESDLKLENFQESINYKFKNLSLLRQALTTPQYAKENNTQDYQILETLGDIVVKLILSLKIYNSGVLEPEILTKQKQCLEDKNSFLRIANEMELEKYVIASQYQEITGTAILADIFESICGAIFLDSERDLNLIENLIIDRYFKDWNKNFKDSLHLSKNQLLEFIQKRLKYTPKLEFEYESISEKDKIRWSVTNLNILDPNGNIAIKIPKVFATKFYGSRKDAEKHISRSVLEYLKQLFDK